MQRRRLFALGIAIGAALLGCGGGGATGAAGHAGAGAGGAAGASTTGGAGAGAGGGTAGAGGSGASAGSRGGSGGTTGPGGNAAGGSAAGGMGGTIPFHPLDMNDVTILAPLPTSSATSVLLRGADVADDGTVFVPRVHFDRLAAAREFAGSSPVLNVAIYDRLHLIAVRFDLCDRHLPGVCPEAEDARLRLVFQPLFLDGAADDVGFHAFYTVRRDEITDAVAALRDLAMIAPPQTGALRVSPALSAANPEPYAAKVRAFVKRYGGEARMVRLTVNAQPQIFSQVRWVLRGVEKRGDAFVDMPMVGASATDISESVILSGDPGYDVMPVTDTPSGFLGAINTNLFVAANATKQRDYLAALAAVENPMTHTAETVACVACHVTTVITSARATRSSIDPLTLPERYTSRFDLSTAAGKSATTPQTIRALGYVGRQPLISQRVVNDTAQTLAEIEQRYPPLAALRR